MISGKAIAKGGELVAAGFDDFFFGRGEVGGGDQDVHGVDSWSVFGDQVDESSVSEISLVSADKEGVAHCVVDVEAGGCSHFDDRSANAAGVRSIFRDALGQLLLDFTF